MLKYNAKTYSTAKLLKEEFLFCTELYIQCQLPNKHHSEDILLGTVEVDIVK